MSAKSWVLVPVEPTGKMVDAGDWADANRLRTGFGVQGVWSAMLSASPDPTTDEALVARLAWKIADALGDGLHGNSPGYINAARAAIRAMEEKP